MRPTLFIVPGIDLPVQAWGFFVAAALILGWIHSLRLARVDKLPADRLSNAYVLAVAFGLVGARALWIVQQSRAGDAEQTWSALVRIQAGGMALGGGLLFGLVATFLFTRTRKIPFFAWTDCMGAALLLGGALERLGAFMAGADFGTLVDDDFLLGVRFPADSLVYAYQQGTIAGLNLPATESLPVHPAPLYAMAICLAGYGLVRAMAKRRQFSGQVTLVAVAVYVFARMGVEDTFRMGGSDAVLGPVTSGMVSALVLVAVLVAIYAASARQGLKRWRGGPWSPTEDSKG